MSRAIAEVVKAGAVLAARLTGGGRRVDADAVHQHAGGTGTSVIALGRGGVDAEGEQHDERQTDWCASGDVHGFSFLRSGFDRPSSFV
jgi:hypothetical protein